MSWIAFDLTLRQYLQSWLPIDNRKNLQFRAAITSGRRANEIEKGYADSNGILKLVNFNYKLPCRLTRYIINIMSIYTYRHWVPSLFGCEVSSSILSSYL